MLPEQMQAEVAAWIKKAEGDLPDLTDAAVVSRYPGEVEEYDRATADSLVQKALVTGGK